jgi:hypothetical protein
MKSPEAAAVLAAVFSELERDEDRSAAGETLLGKGGGEEIVYRAGKDLEGGGARIGENPRKRQWLVEVIGREAEEHLEVGCVAHRALRRRCSTTSAFAFIVLLLLMLSLSRFGVSFPARRHSRLSGSGGFSKLARISGGFLRD